MKPVATGAWAHTGSSSRPSITGGGPLRRSAARLRRPSSAGSQSLVGQVRVSAARAWNGPSVANNKKVKLHRHIVQVSSCQQELGARRKKVSGDFPISRVLRSRYDDERRAGTAGTAGRRGADPADDRLSVRRAGGVRAPLRAARRRARAIFRGGEGDGAARPGA